jgi:hypothetical protein
MSPLHIDAAENLILMNQRTYICHNGIFLWLLLLIVLLPLSGCSPLYLVNSLSKESDSVYIVQQRYGKERRQQLDIFIPEKVVTGSPVVVFFYGGAGSEVKRVATGLSVTA